MAKTVIMMLLLLAGVWAISDLIRQWKRENKKYQRNLRKANCSKLLKNGNIVLEDNHWEKRYAFSDLSRAAKKKALFTFKTLHQAAWALNCNDSFSDFELRLIWVLFAVDPRTIHGLYCPPLPNKSAKATEIFCNENQARVQFTKNGELII